mgnify:FL=1
MIKYLGSKRTMLPLLNTLIGASGATSGLDLFTGTTRVGQLMKQAGMFTTVVDTATYSEVFGKTYITLDSRSVNQSELIDALDALNRLPGTDGYVTQKFCLEARYFQPKNGMRIDAIRSAIESAYRGSWLYEPLLSSLISAADKVDSTTGVQMAYLKTWSRRSHAELTLKLPELLVGEGRTIRTDATEALSQLHPVDLAYLDPPYNQHRYFGNYHVWESLVRWDHPDTYGVANKRLDVRAPENKSVFNSKLTGPEALNKLVANLEAETLMLSYNDEAWITKAELIEICRQRGEVALIEVDSKRYIGSQIGIYNKAGELVGSPGKKRNTEYLLIAGDSMRLKKMLDATS